MAFAPTKPWKLPFITTWGGSPNRNLPTNSAEEAYFSSIAYVLLQTLRRTALAGTELAKAQCGTIRLKLLKIGAQIRVTVRKIWVSLAESYPHAELFAQVLATLETGSAT